jgi:atlastin
MEDYLKEILAERQHEDLQSVREHIDMCFEQVGCFLMPHPGFAVTSKTYNGDLTKIRPCFLTFLRSYVESIFTKGNARKRRRGEKSKLRTLAV